MCWLEERIASTFMVEQSKKCFELLDLDNGVTDITNK
jgi:hypothetical protein